MNSIQPRFTYIVERVVEDGTTRDSRILRSHEWSNLGIALKLYRRAMNRRLPGTLRLFEHDRALQRYTVLCSAPHMPPTLIDR